MPDIKKFPNIIEAMKYLEPGLLGNLWSEEWGGAINYQAIMPVSMPDGRCPSLSISESLIIIVEKMASIPAVNPVSTGSRNAKIRSAPWRRLMNLCAFC